VSAFVLSGEHEALRASVRRFAEEQVAPYAAEADERAEFPWKAFEAYRHSGFIGLPYPEEHGGDGADMIAYAILVEEIARVCGSAEADGYRRLVTFVTELYEVEMKHFIDRNLDSPLDLVNARLLRLFPSTVEVPPLRHHVEDVQQLAPFFVARLGYGGQLTCSAEVLQMLMRANWPGNVEQVFQTMRRVVQHRRTGSIQPRDLPSEIQSVSRRLLSPLESIERDAIAQSLLDARGNKAKAAKSLGMSRATIYRKIREYGASSPRRALTRLRFGQMRSER